MTTPAPHPPRPRRLIFGLISAERALRRWIDARSEGTPVGAAGAAVLFYLAGRGPSPVTHIARALGSSPAATTGLLNRLSDAGVVEKSVSPDDARSKLVALTDAGTALLPKATAVLGDLTSRITNGFTEAELETVERWLAHVAEVTTEP